MVNVEPLTAVAAAAGSYGVQKLVSGLTGENDLGGLAGQLFSAMAASEGRLSGQLSRIEQRLAGIEQRLDEVLDQRYEVAIRAGLRSLLEAANAGYARARLSDLAQARDRFRDATAAARSSLQSAIAERYLVVTAVGLGRFDAARTAWTELSMAVTAAAIEVSTAMIDSREVVRRRTAPLSQRVKAADGVIRERIGEAAVVVEHLLREAGVLGEMVGQPAPSKMSSTIWAMSSEARSGTTGPAVLRAIRWEVDMVGRDLARIGAFTVRWEGDTPVPTRRRRIIEVETTLTITASRPLPFDVPIIVRDPGGLGSLGSPWDKHEKFPAGGTNLSLVDVWAMHELGEQGNEVGDARVDVGPFRIVKRPQLGLASA